MQNSLFFELRAGALELDGRGAESFGNVFVGGEALEVHGVEHGKHVHGDIKRRLGIVDEIADNGVVLAEIAVAGDQAKNLIGEAGHRGEGFHFLVGEARGLQHGALDDLVVVADERAAGFRTTLHGELHTLRNGHFRQTLNQSLSPCRVGFNRSCGFRERSFVDEIVRAVKFVELIFLIDGQRGRLLESGGQRGRFAYAVEFFHQRLNAESREMANYGNEMFGRTVFVLHHGVADAGLVGKIFSRVGEERGESLLAFEGFDEGFYRLRENRILRAGGDDFVGVAGKNGENFRAFRGSKMRTAGANGDFSFACGAAAAQIFENFGAERFHRIMASSPCE